jgi:hypothetical protein
LIYNGNVLTWLVEGCPQYSHLCDVSLLTQRVLEFATRKNGGCGEDSNSVNATDIGNDEKTVAATTTKTNLVDTLRESATEHPIVFLILSMMVSFSLCSLVTLTIMVWCHRRPLKKQRDQSELVAGTDPLSSEFGMTEPEVVID